MTGNRVLLLFGRAAHWGGQRCRVPRHASRLDAGRWCAARLVFAGWIVQPREDTLTVRAVVEVPTRISRHGSLDFEGVQRERLELWCARQLPKTTQSKRVHVVGIDADLGLDGPTFGVVGALTHDRTPVSNH